jgi:hypothetical protein
MALADRGPETRARAGSLATGHAPQPGWHLKGPINVARVHHPGRRRGSPGHGTGMDREGVMFHTEAGGSRHSTSNI